MEINELYPLTGLGVVSRIFTDLAVVHVEAGRFVLRELLPGIGFEQIQSLTGAELHVESEVLNLEIRNSAELRIG